jgi:hypothetical protein
MSRGNRDGAPATASELNRLLALEARLEAELQAARTEAAGIIEMARAESAARRADGALRRHRVAARLKKRTAAMQERLRSQAAASRDERLAPYRACDEARIAELAELALAAVLAGTIEARSP